VYARSQVANDEFMSALQSEIEDAKAYIDTDIGPGRVLATKYFNYELFGNEEEGRSKVVSPDVRDTCIAFLPDLLRIFLGPEHVAEFEPRGEEDVAEAEQATDYVSYILKNDNPGFMVFYSAFLDGLVRKNGFVKYWWDETEKVETYQLTGVDPLALEMLAAAEGCEYEITSEKEGVDEQGQPLTLVDATATKRTKDGRVKLSAVPVEEIIVCRDARSWDTARYVGHRSSKTLDEIVAMGFDRKEVEEHASPMESLEWNEERQARNPYGEMGTADVAPKFEIVESYFRYDYDGDGVAELRKVITIGNHELLNEPFSTSAPFADFSPYPEPHTFFGDSVADTVMDIQRVKSALWRNILDSAAGSIHPRTVAVKNQCDMQSVLNTEVGAVVVESAPNMVRELVKPFIGKEMLPLLDYQDSARENRTGVSKAAAGLDPDALQSTTKDAVAATISGKNAMVGLVARVFAETGMRRVFQGVLELITAHQDRARMVKLRNQWVPVNPSVWEASRNVIINVAVGTGTQEERLTTLKEVALHQASVIETHGLSNPLVGLPELRYTLGKILEMSGFKDTTKFYKEVPADYEPPPQPQGGNDPLIQAQVEVAKAEIQAKMFDSQLKEVEARRKDDRERDRNEMEFWLKAREIELKYQTKLDEAEIKAQVERQRV
jgi:hypothetical protein